MRSAAAFLLPVVAVVWLSSSSQAGPVMWASLSLSAWVLYLLARGKWSDLSHWDKQQLFWAIGSLLAFLLFLKASDRPSDGHSAWHHLPHTQIDPAFRSWGDVYFFCGSRLQYCSCDFHWNLGGRRITHIEPMHEPHPLRMAQVG